MKKPVLTQRIISIANPTYTDDIRILADNFLVARKAENLSRGSLQFYADKLKLIIDYCEAQQVRNIKDINPDFIRRFMLYLEGSHNPGGVHAAFRTLRALLNWYELEFEPDDWKNPIRKVKAPRVPIEPLEPIDIETVKKLVDACDHSFTGDRDRAIFLTLLDTGMRAKELLGVDLDGVDFITGAVLVRAGKGRKPRTVFIGQRTRKAIKAYLKHSVDRLTNKLFINISGEPLRYGGLREIVKRRAILANIAPPSLHSFRRAFAIGMLRAGVDVFSIQKLMGHSDLQVLRRYLAQTSDDIQTAHRKGSPIDNAF